jgi:hypothetical protein
MQLKIFILMLSVFVWSEGFSQQINSLTKTKPEEINIVTQDSAKIALDIVVDSSGKLISVTFVADGSTSNNQTMIDIAKKRAHLIKYPANKEQYSQRLIFNFKIVQ